MLAQALAVFLLAVLPADVPFADLDYAAALAKAKEQQKLLIVDFTASRCGPCKRMEAKTWPAAEVEAWLGQNAIAIQVDVDQEKKLAQQFKVTAMPTVVVLRGSEEFDRVVGYKDADAFLAWAQEVKRATDLADSEDVRARWDLARDLQLAERYDLALEHYLWVWPASRKEEGMGGVRVSFMLAFMADLAREYPPANAAFLEILAGLEAQVAGDGVPESLPWQEWSSMCRRFDERHRVVAWYENHRDAEGRLFAEHSRDDLVIRIVGEVADVLVEENRLLDAARLFSDPYVYAEAVVESFEENCATLSVLGEETRKSHKGVYERNLIKQLAVVYTALLGAGRSEEAVEIGDLLLDTLDTPEARLALVSAGAAVAQGPEESLERWLDEAEAAGADVRELRSKLERLTEAKAAAGEK